MGKPGPKLKGNPFPRADLPGAGYVCRREQEAWAGLKKQLDRQEPCDSCLSLQSQPDAGEKGCLSVQSAEKSQLTAADLDLFVEELPEAHANIQLSTLSTASTAETCASTLSTLACSSCIPPTN